MQLLTLLAVATTAVAAFQPSFENDFNQQILGSITEMTKAMDASAALAPPKSKELCWKAQVPRKYASKSIVNSLLIH